MIYRGEDLPFTLDGMVPDIILNPHAIPSRMTMSQILESVKSKYGCYAGLQDGSPFNGDTAEDLQEMLHSMGFKGDGTQVMQCGVTGERLHVPIFIGPTFYQRLKHNSEEKLHARGRGRTDFLTRQPNEGRANGGGLRVGESEFVCVATCFCLILTNPLPLVLLYSGERRVTGAFCPSRACGTPDALVGCLRDAGLCLRINAQHQRWSVQPLRSSSTCDNRALCFQIVATRAAIDDDRSQIAVAINKQNNLEMLIVYGDSKTVNLAECNGTQVWTTGVKTPRNVLQTYQTTCILVVNNIDDLFMDLTGVFVINEGGSGVCEEAILRGGYCLNTTMSEGLWHLRDVIRDSV
jgi:hypothetical protein